jgi:octaprenyl-diphosphate synthase
MMKPKLVRPGETLTEIIAFKRRSFQWARKGLTRLRRERKFRRMLAVESKAAGRGVASPRKINPNRSWKQLVEPVEPFLETVTEQLMRQAREFDPQIVPYARYALAGSGKRLRPTLVALAARSLGPVKEEHATVAVIIEMVHLATLVHDDVMDEAEIRRGQPTLAANWGNEIAVLFGDCLFAQAVKLAASFLTPEVCRAVAAATNTVCTGEILQTRSRRNFEVSRREYFRVIEMKTAELFTLSCDLAALLSEAPARQRAALRAFGTAFGTAYQVYDDCVDLFGTEALAGKSLGTDLAKGKLTWPVLLAWERADIANRARLEKMIENWQPENLSGVNELLAQYETFEPSLAVVGRYLDNARRALRILPESCGRTGLLGLADFLAQQTDALAVSI